MAFSNFIPEIWNAQLLLDFREAATAAALGIRPGTVKSRLSRALAQLEPQLAHLHQEDPS